MASPRYRYGLFLRPPARLAQIQANAHALLRAQYGLVAAGAFPPHVTILGHIPTEVAEAEIIRASAAATDTVPAVHLFNAGLAPYHGGICHGVGRLQGGQPNPALLDLFRRARTHLDPLRTALTDQYTGGVTEEAQFYAHMSLAGHDLARRPDLADEVLEFLIELDIAAIGEYIADTVSLYRFETASGWEGPWWETMTWKHLRSFRLQLDANSPTNNAQP